MAKHLWRLFTSMIPQPMPRSGMSEYSASRLICSSTQRFQVHKENHGEQVSEEKDKVRSGRNRRNRRAVKKKKQRGAYYVNKETGEIGGPRGPEPTRYGDWEQCGRCSDF